MKKEREKKQKNKSITPTHILQFCSIYNKNTLILVLQCKAAAFREAENIDTGMNKY